jgi:hypothetical protein
MDPVGITNAWQSVALPKRRRTIVTAHSAKLFRFWLELSGRAAFTGVFKFRILVCSQSHASYVRRWVSSVMVPNALTFNSTPLFHSDPRTAAALLLRAGAGWLNKLSINRQHGLVAHHAVVCGHPEITPVHGRRGRHANM